MKPADLIIEKFGSVRRLARMLGHENPTTVQGWKERGSIPVRHAQAIIEASAALDKPVVATDFIPIANASAGDFASPSEQTGAAA